MRLLLVYPSPLMYSELYVRLEPLGLERVASAALAAGHEVALIDLQTHPRRDYTNLLASFAPQAVGFCGNYLANVPEIFDLAHEAKAADRSIFVFVGGHSASFIAETLLEQGAGAIDAVARGEGETVTPALLAAVPDGPSAWAQVPGVVTENGHGPAPQLLADLHRYPPARHLVDRRRRYFIGVLDPCASIEFTRGCPWDCSFCSAWTFYGRSYRRADPVQAAAELASIEEPNVFIVDDVAFIKAEHGHAIADEVARRGIRKEYYLETRADVLLRNPEVFERWRALGLNYMFLGMEALDETGLELFRKRVHPDENFEALALARKIGMTVAINLIVDPQWDAHQFELVREWAMSVPEIVHLTVMTPYPGTEIWHTDARMLTTRDYRLFDIQHAVTPTKLPLAEFYRELVATQSVLARKHLGFAALAQTFTLLARQLAHGQTNFARMIWKFNSVYNAERQYADHHRPVRYELPAPAPRTVSVADRRSLYVHSAPPVHQSASGATHPRT
ncbi:MAG: hopanoid C-3 methylase HpnR [Mycobacteriales bacterium]